jgi:hypothetical protein
MKFKKDRRPVPITSPNELEEGLVAAVAPEGAS